MNIKYIFIALSFVVSALSLNSCSDELNISPDGRISMNDIFSDNDKVAAFLNSCYTNLPTKGMLYYFWMRGPVEISDDAWDADAEAEPSLMSGRMYNGNASSSDHPIIDAKLVNEDADYWDYDWNSIHNCTIFLNRIGTATVRSESDRHRWTAEAHLLRAYYYSELLKWFGCPLPIETTAYTLTDDYSKIKRSSYYDVVKFIMSDCDSALKVNDLELPWRITNGESARVSKALASALKSRMILYAASPLYNKNNNYWEEAYTVNKNALDTLRAKGYALYKNVNFPATYSATSAYLPNAYAALYNEYFTNSMGYSATVIDKETIYQTNSNQGQTWFLDGIGAQGGYKTGTCPTQELVDAFETTDGQPILNLANPYLDEKHTQPNYNHQNTLYDPNNPYINRDPRFYADIYYNGSKRKAAWSFDETPSSYENYPAKKGNRVRVIATYTGEPQTGIDRSSRTATRTGYYERKFLHPTSGADQNTLGANFKDFRLGEIILNFAEAAAEANHLDEARNAVNEIRERVGMPDIPTGLSQSDLILRVRHERRVELCMEEDRYFDVRRWTSPTGDLSSTDKWVTAMEITRIGNNQYTYMRRPVRALPRACYTNKYLWCPISLNEENRMKTLTGENWQNPGW